MNLREKVSTLREQILTIAERHGASNVRLFGSVSRGTESDSSDIDFLVVLEPGRSLFDHAALKVELEELLGRRVDIATEKGLKEQYRSSILAEAIAI